MEYIYLYVILIITTMATPIIPKSPFGYMEISEVEGSRTNKNLEVQLDCASQRTKALRHKLKHTTEGPSKNYIPSCTKSDQKKYERMQCFDNKSFCWCVNEKTGEPLIGTSTIRGKPICNNDVKTISNTAGEKKRKIKKNRCSGSRRNRFLRRLISSYRTELIMNENRKNTTRIGRETALQWKFDQLDLNKNKIIEKSEWKPYKAQLLSEWKSARHCSRSLFKTCDSDRNRKLTFEEWRNCFVQDLKMVAGTRSEKLNPFLYILKPE